MDRRPADAAPSTEAHLPECAAIAAVLADLTPHPLVALDVRHRIRLFNGQMESLLGLSRADAVGKTFEEICASAEPEELPRAAIDEALAGKRRGGQSLTTLRCGDLLSFSWEFTIVTSDGHPALIAIARAWAERPKPPPGSFADDIHYEITTTEREFGVIRNVWAARPDAQALVGQRCYAALGRRAEVCPDCPAHRPAADGARFAIVPLPESNGSYNVVTVEASGDATARVGSRRITGGLLNDLLTARVNDVAARQRLSSREREVLHALVAGRASEDIARELGISQRTVKFHQANVLEKLGADSRVDLLRLIF